MNIDPMKPEVDHELARKVKRDRILLNNPVVMQGLGLAPLVVKDIFNIIKRLREEGITILLIEQNANAALNCADYGYVMQTGRITLSGTGQELLTDKSVQEAYLGKQQKK